MCDQCGGLGWLRVDVPLGDPQFGKTIICSCKSAELAARLQRLSGLSDRERNIALDQIETVGKPGTAAMVNRCREFIGSPFGFVTIWGEPGNAKTLALQSVVNHFVRHNSEAVYVTAFDLISYIRDAFYKTPGNDLQINDDNAYSRLRRFERVPVLAVDEFDKVRVTEWVQEQLTDLIDRRYRLGEDRAAGTLIALNTNPRDLPSWMYSRLAQSTIVYNADEDMRPELGREIGYVPAV
jgi:DNA replication protein DnaC